MASEVRCWSCNKLIGYADVVEPTGLLCPSCHQRGKQPKTVSQELEDMKSFKVVRKRLTQNPGELYEAQSYPLES